MKLEKAIEILILKVKGCNIYLSKETDDATKLGIEALKRLEKERVFSDLAKLELLPGETDE